MFNKYKLSEVTIIGSAAEFKGNLKVKGQLQIDGFLNGTIESEGVVSVGPQGKIHGIIKAKDVAIAGNFDGKAWVSGQFHILSTGTFCGEVQYKTLQIDNGGCIEGRTEIFARSDKTLSLPENSNTNNEEDRNKKELVIHKSEDFVGVNT